MLHEEGIDDDDDEGRYDEGDHEHWCHIRGEGGVTIQRPGTRVLDRAAFVGDPGEGHADDHRRGEHESRHPDDGDNAAREADAAVLEGYHRVNDRDVALNTHHGEDVDADVHGEHVDAEDQAAADVAEQPAVLVVVRERVEQTPEDVEQIGRRHVDDVRVDGVDVDAARRLERQQDHQGVGADANDEYA